LAAGVAHELRNPLTGVKLMIQAATKRPADRPLSAQQLSAIQEQIIRMEKTIQGLLDYARPPEMHRVTHDVRDTMRRALNLVEGHARQATVKICEDFCRTPVWVEGDPGQLHQVFVNLLLNGIEAMPGGGALGVAVQDAAAPDGSCRVTVTDSGTGIAEHVLERLFEPFVTSKERGTGLGLAISRRIVQQHGGKLMAANRQEGGAVFSVELPQCSEPPALDAGGPGEACADQPAISRPTSYRHGEAHDAPIAHH
jgi:signal transduction histidine kinase